MGGSRMKKKSGIVKLQIIGMILGLVLLSTGCGAAKSSRSETAPQAAEMNFTNEANSADAKSEADLFGKNKEAPMSASSVEEEGMDNGNPALDTSMAYNRKMIKTGEMHIQTKEFKACVEALGEKVQSLGGYIQSSNIQGNDYYNDYRNMRSAYLEVRLPQEHFDNFLNSPQEYGNVISTVTNSEDITDQYVDTEIRLKSLKTRHERLLTLLEKSGSLEELFEIEKELGDVTYELEKAGGTLQKYDQLVNMSTISIQIQEVQKIQEVRSTVTFKDRLSTTFNESVEGMIDLTQNILLMLVACIPYLLILIPIAGLIIFIIISSDRRGRKKALEKNKKHDNLVQKQEGIQEKQEK